MVNIYLYIYICSSPIFNEIYEKIIYFLVQFDAYNDD
jgi:hypothetical protein